MDRQAIARQFLGPALETWSDRVFANSTHLLKFTRGRKIDLVNEFNALTGLRASGFRCPNPVALEQSGNTWFLVTERVEGLPINDAFSTASSSNKWDGVAHLLVQLHTTDYTSIVIKFSDDDLPIGERLTVLVQRAHKKLGELSDGVVERLLASPPNTENVGVVHRDLVPANILVSDEVTFVDFETAAIAPITWDFVKLKRQMSPDEFEAFCLTYGNHRQLPTNDDIGWFEAFEALTFYAFAKDRLSPTLPEVVWARNYFS